MRFWDIAKDVIRNQVPFDAEKVILVPTPTPTDRVDKTNLEATIIRLETMATIHEETNAKGSALVLRRAIRYMQILERGSCNLVQPGCSGTSCDSDSHK